MYLIIWFILKLKIAETPSCFGKCSRIYDGLAEYPQTISSRLLHKQQTVFQEHSELIIMILLFIAFFYFMLSVESSH